ncbi:hypothetical protein [Schlesneria sp. DSM 10557]|uniref:hypothetical protein n=1 Tax=Schlesneria sp. DSM 10557 TaxID=3044399 RepID=UPI0035A006B3
MAREVRCERCQEAFLIETDDIVGNCPKCGEELAGGNSAAVPLGLFSVGEPQEFPPSEAVETAGVTSDAVWSPAVTEIRSLDRVTPRPASKATVTRKETGANPTESQQSRLAFWLVVVASYASLLTIYVIYQIFFRKPHQLESLPDLLSVQQSGGTVAVPLPENDLPAGHELRLGQSRRYGDIVVTPLRVSRGPINFSHYTGNEVLVRSPSDPVLKLWFRFENVSPHQSIRPLDPTLMYFRLEADSVLAFNVIFPASDQKLKEGRRYYHFDRLPAESEWRIAGHETGRLLAPGEDFETFAPSQEGIEDLSGEVVWRIHFRKGHGPKTGNGVTTLIDVRFHSDEIQEEV